MSVNEWLSYLSQQGFNLDGRQTVQAVAAEIDNNTLPSSDVICDLSTLAVIKITGNDCTTFLQGQLTNDVEQISDEQGQLSAYCSPKGRMFTDMRLFKHQGDLHLLMPYELQEKVIKRLRMFVLRADVTFEDQDEACVRIGVSGPNSDDVVSALGFPKIEPLNGVSRHDGMTLIRIEGIPSRYIIIVPNEKSIETWETLSAKLTAISSRQWRLLDIISGLPAIETTSSEQFVPQMINWDKLDGISLKKGCYVGQEIIARSHYLGKQKKGLRYGEVKDTDKPLHATLRLQAANQSASQSAGQIINAAELNPGHWLLLASVDLETSAETAIHLETAEGPEVHWLD